MGAIVTDAALASRVVALVTRELNVPAGSVTAATASTDLDEWDSLGHLQICMALESEFGISPELETLAELDSVPAIVDYLEQAGVSSD